MPRRQRWRLSWPLLVTVILAVLTYIAGGVGIYVGISNQLAVQSVKIDNVQKSSEDVKKDLKDRIDSLERNFSGIQNLIVTMHQNERNETRTR